jgi:hypothetical protein
LYIFKMNQPNNNSNNNPNRRNNQLLTPPRAINLSSNIRTGGSGGYSGSKVIGIVILVVVLVLLVGACYWLYTVYSNRVFQTTVETEVMPDVKDASSNFSVGNGSIPSSNYSNEYSISMWLNIDNYTYNYGKEKIILRRGEKGEGNPEIVLDAKTNDLIVRLKLQNAGNVANPLVASVSKFADIPKVADALDTLDKVGSNLVDYPMIQYQISSGCNVLTTLKPEERMTIMIEDAARLKEKQGFQANGEYDLARVDTSRLSDNSAPLESRNVYNNEYFAQISGNEVQLDSRVAKLKEGFDTVSDLTNACIAIMLDLCKIASTLQSKTTADNQVAALNAAFQTVLDTVANTRNTSTSVDEISAAFVSSLGGLSTLQMSDSSLAPLIESLVSNFMALQAASTQANAASVSMTSMQSTINAKLSSMNCPLVLTGSNDIDITANFYQSFINMVKKSLFTYINNMGAGLQKAMPELANATSASCIIQNITNSDPTVGTCIFRAIPLQKWVHVVVSVYNQVVDIFIDGQLASSCVLKAYPAISTSNVVITPDGGFAGKISRVVFSNTAMTVQHAKQLYYAGPVATSGLLSMIPDWVWYSVIFLIIIAIAYSILM